MGLVGVDDDFEPPAAADAGQDLAGGETAIVLERELHITQLRDLALATILACSPP
jgi:hypothetical protein